MCLPLGNPVNEVTDSVSHPVRGPSASGAWAVAWLSLKIVVAVSYMPGVAFWM